jgi:hypothetical protein
MVGTDITGGSEAIHVRVPAGFQAGQNIDVTIPREAITKQDVPQGDNAVPNAWASADGMDFYEVAQKNAMQMTIGGLEVVVRHVQGQLAPTIQLNYNANAGRSLKTCWVVFFIIVFVGLVIGLSVGFTVGREQPAGSRCYSTVSGYTGQSCSSFYREVPDCDECPTTPLGETSGYCWEDDDVIWSSFSPAIQSNWTVLGYTESMWNSGQLSDVVNKCWNDLSAAESQAAVDLGYYAYLWNYPCTC